MYLIIEVYQLIDVGKKYDLNNIKIVCFRYKMGLERSLCAETLIFDSRLPNPSSKTFLRTLVYQFRNKEKNEIYCNL